MVKRLTTSVIIPVYNESAYIEKLLKSLQKQTLLPDEIIVVDNNSTDNTVKKVQQFKNVKIIHEKQQGNVFARNHGFDVARGDILVKLDADSLPKPNWLAQYYSYFIDNKLDALSGKIEFKEAYFQKTNTFFMNLFLFRINKMLIGHYPLFGSNYMIKADTWSHIKNLVHADNSIWEDLDVTIQSARIGAKIGHFNDKLMVISIRSFSVGIIQGVKILLQWPRTYKNNKKYCTAVALYPIGLIVFLLNVSRFWVLFGYHPNRATRSH